MHIDQNIKQMDALKNMLMSFINDEKYVCRLCFKELGEDSICNTKDEVILDAELNNNITILGILKELVADNIDIDNPLLDVVCNACTKSAIDAYKFLLICRNSAKFLQTLVFNFTTCLNLCESKSYMAKTIYLSFNNVDKCEPTCDFKKHTSHPGHAIKRFVSLKKKKCAKDSRNKIKKRKPREVSCAASKDDNANVKVFICQYCLKTFGRHYNLTEHYNRVHAPKTFACSECPRRFGSAYLLKLHLSESHVQLMCAECGKTYNNVHSLKLHEMSAHEAKLLCHSCGKYYKNRLSYRKHVSIGTCTRNLSMDKNLNSFRRYTCDTCQKSYATKGALRVHIGFEHGNSKAFICDWCGKRFPARSRLLGHIVKHTKEKNFNCDICGGKFVTRESLLYHTRIHTGEKPYACSHCEQKFLSASRRMEHIRRKHMEPSLLCKFCNNVFKTGYCLKKHMKRHTNPSSRLYNENAKSDCMDLQYNEF